MTELERALRIIETQQKKIEELEAEVKKWQGLDEAIKKIAELQKQIPVQPWQPLPDLIPQIYPFWRDWYTVCDTRMQYSDTSNKYRQ